jgi:fructoselysine 6-kinase
MSRIVAVGDNVVDCYPALGQMFPGGNCLNVAVLACRAGAQTGYVGAIGRDDAGRAIEAALAAEGVDVTHLRTPGGQTAYCVIGHQGADRIFLRADLGVSRFEPSESDFAFVDDFDAVHVGQSSGLDAHLERFARKSRLSYDFSTRRDTAHRATVAPHCFLASISGGDLSREEGLQMVKQVIAGGASWCLLTRGEKGAMLASKSAVFEIPAAPTIVVIRSALGTPS